MFKSAFKHLFKLGINALNNAIFGSRFDFELGATDADVYEQHRPVLVMVVPNKEDRLRWN